MINAAWLAVICICYAGILFLIAYLVDRDHKIGPRRRQWMYSLSLVVYCSSWTLFGVIGHAATMGWSFLSIYLGPILVFLLARRWLREVIRVGKNRRSTSIADFIAVRYGRAHNLARLVTLIAVFSSIPYIALQLRAVSLGFELLTGDHTLQSSLPFYKDNAFYVSLVMAVFAMIFGARRIDAAEQHRGVVAAVAFESVVKLGVFLFVGLWLSFAVFDSPAQIIVNAQRQLPAHPLLHGNFWSMSLITQTVMAALAIFLLPRQFQVMVVENQQLGQLKHASKIVPLYLLLMLSMVVPIALGGQLLLPATVSADNYLMALPLMQGQNALALLAFIGGASAATSMIIVATLALSTMLANTWILPLLFKSAVRQELANAAGNYSHLQVKTLVLNVRRAAIVAMVFLSYGFYRVVGNFESLSSLGLLSFAAIVQCAPAFVGGMLWSKGNRYGAISGILVGIALWSTQLMLPIMTQTSVSHSNFLGQLFYRQALWDDFTTGVLLSLSMNLLTYIFISQVTEPSVRERLAASDFLNRHAGEQSLTPEFSCKIDDLRAVMERVIGEQQAHDFIERQRQLHHFKDEHNIVPKVMMAEAENILSSAVGASSTRVIFSTLLGRDDVHINDIATLASETHQAMAMNRSQLQTALENLHQGVCIIDHNLKLVAWNKRYLQIYDYPEGFIYYGQPVEDIIGCNSRRGMCGAGDTKTHIDRRMAHMQRGTAHEYERELPNGTVIFMQGRLMPNGGYVTSFTDITAYRHAANSLQQANVVLEQKIAQNTRELTQLTTRLIEANTNKTRFLAATSHDLIQPVSAAKLFASALANKGLNSEQRAILQHLEGALSSAEEVIGVLTEISKLDAGVMQPQFTNIAIASVMRPLVDEFTAIAAQKGLQLKYRQYGELWVYTDAHWLKRIVQNLLANAVRYTHSGKVLLALRKRGNKVLVEVWDTGIGISAEHIGKVFEEFNRLNQVVDGATSLGLGLAIVKRMSSMLKQPIEVRSQLGVGTCFRFSVDIGQAPSQVAPVGQNSGVDMVEPCRDLRILCIDNDQAVLTAMQVLLQSWQSQVFAYNSLQQVAADLQRPDVLIVDYQLDDGDTGIEVLRALRQRWPGINGILVSAATASELAQQAQQAGFFFLKKPLKPAALRALLRTMRT